MTSRALHVCHRARENPNWRPDSRLLILCEQRRLGQIAESYWMRYLTGVLLIVVLALGLFAILKVLAEVAFWSR